ncbi:MAG: hypothetical protein LUB63_01360, partial [Oscillospiraceae bacterium]|nr:hypothetical protein [Oscillospiraceae bacterium]
MLQHLKYSLPDWALCLLASVGLGMNVVQSFLLPEALSGDILRLTLVCAAVITVMIVLSYSKTTTILSIVLVILGIILVLFLAYLGQVEGFTENEDAEMNARLWYLVVVLCAAIVYLLSRTRLTSWLLLIIGSLCVAYFALLEYTVYLWAALLFLFSVGAWLCFIGYRKNMMKYSAMRTAFLSMVGWSAGVSLLCLAVGGLLWWGIIRPIEPPTQDMVLLTDYLQFNQLEQLGLINDEQVYDSSTLSNWINENYTRQTDEMTESTETDTNLEADDTQEEDHSEDPDEEEQPVTAPDGETHWITYDRENLTSLIILGFLLLLVLAALVVLFLRRRQIWYRWKTKNMDDETYILYFFPWYLTRFKRLKLPAPMGDSPEEYAQRLETSTRFLSDTGVTWAEMSGIFSRLVYGGRGAQPGDREKFEQ